jgi:hypothetical protein
MNSKIFHIPSVYTIWDGLSLKTISRYCPFKGLGDLYPYWSILTRRGEGGLEDEIWRENTIDSLNL